MAKPILTLPCKYTLSDFEQRGGNHHCNACDHSLKDFRNATEAEVQQAIADSNGKTCGMFHPEQVAAKTSTFPLGLQRRVGLSLLGILGFVAPVVTSCEKETVQFPEEKNAEDIEAEAFSKLKFPMTVSGRLTDRYNDTLPLAMATINICHGTTVLRSVRTDADGNFAITLEKGDLKNADFELVVERIGYEPKTIAEVSQLNDYKRRHLSIALKAYPKPADEPVVIWTGNIVCSPITYGSVISNPSLPLNGVPLEPLLEAAKDHQEKKRS